MNENKEMYNQPKKSRASLVLWIVAIIAIAVATALYLWGKTIHDSGIV